MKISIEIYIQSYLCIKMICVPYHDSKILFYYDGDLKSFVFHLMYLIFLNYKIYRDTFGKFINMQHVVFIKNRSNNVHSQMYTIYLISLLQNHQCTEIPTLDSNIILIQVLIQSRQSHMTLFQRYQNLWQRQQFCSNST